MSERKKELIIEFEYLEQQIKLSSEKLDALDTQAAQLQTSIQAIKTISQKNEHEALVPIVNGVYVNATIQKTDSFLVDVGSDVATPKTATEAIKVFEFQLSSTHEYQEKVVQRLELLSKHADELQKEMSSLTQQVK